MINVFYAELEKYSSSSELLKKILNDKFSIFEYDISKNENGKAFLLIKEASLQPLFFSVTHTDSAYFIAISTDNVGIDAEPVSRKIDYLPILKKFNCFERERISNSSDFLKLWTVKEATIKWLGGSIAKDLKRLAYIDGKVTLDCLELPVFIEETELFGHFVSICKEKEEHYILQTL